MKAACDEVIPLSRPITTASGEVVDHITVAQGTTVAIPIRTVNRSEEIWGPDAKEFKPERWLNNESGLPARAKELQGYHHIMSFVDGQRMCLGRNFAVAEFKVSECDRLGALSDRLILIKPNVQAGLSVLLRNFVFEMRDGPETKIEMVSTILPRPKVVGEEGYATPLRVKRAV